MPKILVADDNTNIQRMVALAFSDLDIDVVAVGNGEAAVRRIPELKPDLVLADIFMPVRNGYEVCEFVKKDTRFSHIPVILLVGAFDPLDEKEARRVGADGVLKKPFVPPDPLIAMVTSALEKNPKLAAEMAKAREVPPEPVPPVAAVEIPAKIELKPVPSFPEPTPDEEAMAFGFGKGKRALEDEDPTGGPDAPVSLDAEDDDASSPSWRRNAMDFEIPEETSKSAAFAFDDEASSSMFPSEKQVPPKHVRRKDGEPMAPLAHAPDATIAAERSKVAAAIPETSIETAIEPSAHGAGPEPKPAKDTVLEAPVSVAKQESVPANLEPASGQPPIQEQAPVEIEPVSESEFAARATHWMDAMAAPAKQAEADDWADSISAVRSDLEAKEPLEPVSPALLNKVKLGSAPEVVPAPELKSESIEPAPKADAFSAPEPKEETVAPLSTMQHLRSPEAAPAPAAVVKGSDPDWVAEKEDTRPVERDPHLVVPEAVRVTPEPLLVKDSVGGRSEYNSKPEKAEKPFEFLEPATNGGSKNAVEVTASGSEQQAVIDERIPTGPPPNREALAEIPFLSPPPEALASENEDKAAADEAHVDEMVRRVLEKLEPQLHSLLSQGVLKPLVENVLQSELSKKGK